MVAMYHVQPACKGTAQVASNKHRHIAAASFAYFQLLHIVTRAAAAHESQSQEVQLQKAVQFRPRPPGGTQCEAFMPIQDSMLCMALLYQPCLQVADARSAVHATNAKACSLAACQKIPNASTPQYLAGLIHSMSFAFCWVFHSLSVVPK